MSIQGNRTKGVVPKLARQILDGMTKGLSVRQACAMIDIAPLTFYRWQDKHKILRKAVLSIRTKRREFVEDALYTSALGGSVRAQEFWLINDPEGKWKKAPQVSNTILNQIQNGRIVIENRDLSEKQKEGQDNGYPLHSRIPA